MFQTVARALRRLVLLVFAKVDKLSDVVLSVCRLVDLVHLDDRRPQIEGRSRFRNLWGGCVAVVRTQLGLPSLAHSETIYY